MSTTIHKFLMALGSFCATYTFTKFIIAICGMPHIGTIFLIFVAAVLAFYSNEALGKVISALYLIATVVVSYMVELYYTMGVVTHSFPWPYEINRPAENNEVMLAVFQKSEASFVLLVIICIFSVYYYMRKLKSLYSNKKRLEM